MIVEEEGDLRVGRVRKVVKCGWVTRLGWLVFNVVDTSDYAREHVHW